MSHSIIIINRSLLDIFDPNSTEYAGTRDHFNTAVLTRIDALRTCSDTYNYTLDDRIFVVGALAKAIFTAADS